MVSETIALVEFCDYFLTKKTCGNKTQKKNFLVSLFYTYPQAKITIVNQRR